VSGLACGDAGLGFSRRIIVKLQWLSPSGLVIYQNNGFRLLSDNMLRFFADRASKSGPFGAV
jgi:hypothetical protein